jgi:hypothetical protein
MASKSILSFYKSRRVETELVEPVVEQPLAVGAPLIESEFQNQDEVVLRGIEFLEQDPAKHPQIWEYPINQQDEVRRGYLILGPMQPKLQNYKPSGPKGTNTIFNTIVSVNFPLGWSIRRAVDMLIVFIALFPAKT